MALIAEKKMVMTKAQASGMTLIEVVLSMLLVTVLVGAICKGLTHSVAVNYMVAQRIAAFSLCKDSLEQMRGMEYSTVSTNLFTNEVIQLTHLGGTARLPLTAVRTIDINSQTNPTRKAVTINIAWNYRGRQLSESVDGMLLYKDDSALAGGNILTGDINIDPNNSPDNEFVLTLPDSSTITRDDLHQDYPGYTGLASSIYVMPKGTGNQNGLTLNSQPYPLDNGKLYEIDSNNMQVILYNDHINPSGKAVGKWWIQVMALDAVISVSNPGP